MDFFYQTTRTINTSTPLGQWDVGGLRLYATCCETGSALQRLLGGRAAPRDRTISSTADLASLVSIHAQPGR